MKLSFVNVMVFVIGSILEMSYGAIMAIWQYIYPSSEVYIGLDRRETSKNLAKKLIYAAAALHSLFFFLALLKLLTTFKNLTVARSFSIIITFVTVTMGAIQTLIAAL